MLFITLNYCQKRKEPNHGWSFVCLAQTTSSLAIKSLHKTVPKRDWRYQVWSSKLDQCIIRKKWRTIEHQADLGVRNGSRGDGEMMGGGEVTGDREPVGKGSEECVKKMSDSWLGQVKHDGGGMWSRPTYNISDKILPVNTSVGRRACFKIATGWKSHFS